MTGPERGTAGIGPMLSAGAVATVGVLPVFLTGALAVQLREDLGFGEAGLGLTIAAVFGAAALASSAAGRLAEAVGPRRAMRLAAALAAASLASVALVARSLPALLACLVVGGLGNALAQPATNLALARSVPPERLGTAFGIKQSAIPAATLLGGLAVPAVALTVGWRWAFGLGAVLALGLALAGPGEAVARPADGERPRGRGDDDASLRPLVLLSVGVGLGAAAAGTLGSFLVSGAVDAGIDEGAAGALASGCSAVGIVTRLVAGRRADRRGGRHLVVVAGMMAVGSAGYVALATTSPALVVVGALVGYCVGWSWPGLFNLAVVRANPGAPGAATGITQTGTYLGAVAGPLVFGLLVERSGYPAAWLVAGATSLVASVAVVTGRRALMADRARRATTLAPT